MQYGDEKMVDKMDGMDRVDKCPGCEVMQEVWSEFVVRNREVRPSTCLPVVFRLA